MMTESEYHSGCDGMNPSHRLGDDFDNLMQSLREIPGAAEYLDSPEAWIGHLIMARRADMGYRLHELSEKAGVTLADLDALEWGLTHPQFGVKIAPDAFQKVLRALDLQNAITGGVPSEEAAALMES